MKLPPGWTMDRLIATVQRCMFSTDNTGICFNCGAEQEGCEPDARKYECLECGDHEVYGAEEMLMMVA